MPDSDVTITVTCEPWSETKEVDAKNVVNFSKKSQVSKITFAGGDMKGAEVTYTNGVYSSPSGEFTVLSGFNLKLKSGLPEGVTGSISFKADTTSPSRIKLMHELSTGEWETLTTSYDAASGEYIAVTDSFSPFVIVLLTEKQSSSVTSFFGTKNGNDFTFDRAVVITKATLPGATYATVTNTSGSSWYSCNLSTDGTNGTLFFQVPLDVINVKGYTVNDVSLLGCRTTYLSTEGGYAKYSAVITGSGFYTIDFEKDAAAKAVTETKPVTDTQGYLNVLSTPSGATIQIEGVDYIGFTPQEKISLIPGTYSVTLSLDGYNDVSKTVTVKAGDTTEAVLSLTKTETTAPATAAKSPYPVLGILAGLGIAGFAALRRR